MFLKLQKEIGLANLLKLSKQNKFSINTLLFLSLLLPISLISVPLIIEIIIFLIFLSYFRTSFQSSLNKEKFTYLEILIYSFFIILVLSSLLSDYKLISLKSSLLSVRFIIYAYAILFLLKKIKYFFRYFFIISCISFIFVIFDGYIQLVFGKNIFQLEKINDYIVSGVFGDEKKLGSYIARFFPILIGSYLLVSKSKIKKKFRNIFILSIFIFALLLFTWERVAFLYFVVSMFFVSIFFIKNNTCKKEILIFFAAFIASIYLLISLDIKHFKHWANNTLKQLSPEGRIVYISKQHENFAFTALELFKRNKILGVGPNNFRRECSKINLLETSFKKRFLLNLKSYEKNIESPYKYNCSTHPHNITFQLLSETGIIGFTIYLLIIFLLFKEVLQFFLTKNINNPKIFFLLPFIYYINPIMPSGNFFNNWYMFIGILGIPFYIFLSKVKKSVQ